VTELNFTTQPIKPTANRAVAIARKAFLETPWRGDWRLHARAINEMADRFKLKLVLAQAGF
jgi:hypothetical protein